MEHVADTLSRSLGVAKLSKSFAPALSGFVAEGVRFAFSTAGTGDEEFALGSRLPFLRIISK